MKVLITFLFLCSASVAGLSQCAMCRTTLENSINDNGPGLLEGINLGILYLFFTPYLLVGVIALLWYKTSKKNDVKNMEKCSLVR